MERDSKRERSVGKKVLIKFYTKYFYDEYVKEVGYDNRKIISFTVNAAFFAYMFITVFMRGYHEVVPYSSILFSDV